MIKNEIIRKLNLHVQQNLKIKDDEFWNLVCQTYPQFIENEIEAHRAILQTKIKHLNKNLLMKNGVSWSASQSGMKYFVSIYNSNPQFSFIYCRAKIKAFNIGKLAKYLTELDNSLTLMNHALYEDELICLSYIEDIDEPIVSNLKKLSYL